MVDENTVGIVSILAVFIGLPFAIAYARVIWRRADKPRASLVDTDTAQRLVRIEQAIDTIAVEVERLSEGQRFVTKVLAEREGVALPKTSSS